MNVLDQFSIPYKGLGTGLHELHFDIDDSFFKAFDEPVLNNGKFKVKLYLDKKSDHSILNFEINGHTRTACDRCLADIDLPVYGEYTMHLKFSEDELEDDEIVFMHPETSIVNVAKFIYDIIGVSVPITKIYNCDSDENPPCNQKVLSKLSNEDHDIVESSEQLPSPWDKLKGLDFKN